ncbi:hypothetical protein AUK40_05250 [Candidatus Wirthbacteria bacterium CG2_30_54_11]|uniref:Uncharacterized protein n=1 Tax=Candidatus Wirthbacteria bacterium CG2_30_54_11 TaxID=1817892 RepID=A0A1J5IGE5_9BACT|nr:MAG: hypothetical protein AUK40_05250 [Candidatus Wirthbacteria bacterium CG2_30_54_11]
MSYEDKRHNLIKTIKIITLIVFGVGGVAFGVVAYLMAGREKQAEWRTKLKGFLIRLKAGFDRFAQKSDTP